MESEESMLEIITTTGWRIIQKIHTEALMKMRIQMYGKTVSSVSASECCQGRFENFKLKITNSLVLLNSKWHHAEQKKETCLPDCGFHSGLKQATMPGSPQCDSLFLIKKSVVLAARLHCILHHNVAHSQLLLLFNQAANWEMLPAWIHWSSRWKSPFWPLLSLLMNSCDLCATLRVSVSRSELWLSTHSHFDLVTYQCLVMDIHIWHAKVP